MEDRVELLRAVEPAVLGGAGSLERSLRQAAFDVGRGAEPPEPLSEPLGSFAEKVNLHAFRVADADVDALRRAGYSDDAILEATLAVAAGAGLSRLENGLAALRAEG
jgi:alkylhydroperoxidase family enzyme